MSDINTASPYSVIPHDTSSHFPRNQLVLPQLAEGRSEDVCVSRCTKLYPPRLETCNPASCADLLRNADHRPKTRSLWPSYWVYRSLSIPAAAAAAIVFAFARGHQLSVTAHGLLVYFHHRLVRSRNVIAEDNWGPSSIHSWMNVCVPSVIWLTYRCMFGPMTEQSEK